MTLIEETKKALIKAGSITEEESELVKIMAKYKYETVRNNLSDKEFVSKYNLTWDDLNNAKILNNRIHHVIKD